MKSVLQVHGKCFVHKIKEWQLTVSTQRPKLFIPENFHIVCYFWLHCTCKHRKYLQLSFEFFAFWFSECLQTIWVPLHLHIDCMPRLHNFDLMLIAKCHFISALAIDRWFCHCHSFKILSTVAHAHFSLCSMILCVFGMTADINGTHFCSVSSFNSYSYLLSFSIHSNVLALSELLNIFDCYAPILDYDSANAAFHKKINYLFTHTWTKLLWQDWVIMLRLSSCNNSADWNHAQLNSTIVIFPLCTCRVTASIEATVLSFKLFQSLKCICWLRIWHHSIFSIANTLCLTFIFWLLFCLNEYWHWSNYLPICSIQLWLC